MEEGFCLQGLHACPNHPEERLILLGQQKYCSCSQVADAGPHFKNTLAMLVPDP